jgi:hypothetical protein
LTLLEAMANLAKVVFITHFLFSLLDSKLGVMR